MPRLQVETFADPHERGSFPNGRAELGQGASPSGDSDESIKRQVGHALAIVARAQDGLQRREILELSRIEPLPMLR